MRDGILGLNLPLHSEPFVHEPENKKTPVVNLAISQSLAPRFLRIPNQGIFFKVSQLPPPAFCCCEKTAKQTEKVWKCCDHAEIHPSPSQGSHSGSEVAGAEALLSPSRIPESDPPSWLSCRKGNAGISPAELAGTRGCSTSIPRHQLQDRSKQVGRGNKSEFKIKKPTYYFIFQASAIGTNNQGKIFSLAKKKSPKLEVFPAVKVDFVTL